MPQSSIIKIIAKKSFKSSSLHNLRSIKAKYWTEIKFIPVHNTYGLYPFGEAILICHSTLREVGQVPFANSPNRASQQYLNSVADPDLQIRGDSLVSRGRQKDSCKRVCGFKNIQIRVDVP